MRVPTLLALLLLTVGAALLFQGFRQGEGDVYLLVVSPVFVFRGPLSLIGSILILASFFLGSLSMGRFFSGGALRMFRANAPVRSERGRPTKETEGRFGGILLMGPVPIVFGSDERIIKGMLIAGMVITVVLLFLFLTSLGG